MKGRKVIVIDDKIPFIRGILEPYADVRYLAPSDIDRTAVHDADVLIVRTRTRCNADLLDGSRCRFIGTATIGYDHIDADYCRRQGIEWRFIQVLCSYRTNLNLFIYERTVSRQQ